MEMVEKILFIDDFNIGHSVVDHQHKMIINEINGFIEEANNNVEPEFAMFMLEELLKEYKRHYAYEEKLLTNLDDINFLAHQTKHQDASNYLQSIIASIQNKESIDFKEIAELLKINVIQHIAEDMELKNRFVESKHY